MNTVTSKPEVQIIADPEIPKITITREFEATPDKVFRAHVERDLFAEWIGPRGYETKIDRWDPTTGGGYRYATYHEGQELAAFYGSFHEVRPSERLVQTFTWEGMPDGVSLDAMTFEELPGGRTRLTVVSIVDSMEAQAAVLASGMEKGVVEGYEKLDAMLEGAE